MWRPWATAKVAESRHTVFGGRRRGKGFANILFVYDGHHGMSNKEEVSRMHFTHSPLARLYIAEPRA